MGTAVWIEKAHFRMSAAGERAGVAAMKAAFPSEQVFLAKGIHERPAAYREFSSATSLGGLVRALIGLGEHLTVNEMPEGGVSGCGREGMMDELPARAVARRAAPDQHVHAEGARHLGGPRADRARPTDQTDRLTR